MMDLAGGVNLINNSIGILVGIGAIASWPAVRRRFSELESFKGRRDKRRRLLRRYLRARTLASRPSVGLADMGAIGCVMILTGVWLLVTTIGLVIRRSEGPPPTVEDAVSVFLMLVLLAFSFMSACSVAAEIKNAPRTARRLKAGLRKPKYRPLSAGDGSCPCIREAA